MSGPAPSLLALLLLGSTLGACGDDDVTRRDGGDADLGVSPADSGGPDAPAPPPPPGDGGPGDAAPDAPAERDSGPLACGPGGGGFPDFDRACGADSECFVAYHQTDCCGSLAALGLASSQRTAFDEAERLCSAMFPPCGCAGGPTRTDDGTTVFGGPDAIAVACRAGRCHTSVVVACGTGVTSFPEPDRSCTLDTDCALAMHQTDCCGTLRARGIAASQQALFEAAEAECRSMAPDCDCAAMPTMTDDGSTVTGGPESVLVECRSGACTSSPRGV